MPTTDPPAAVLAVIGTKGGTGKTTAAGLVAHALHERGLRVYAIDADPQQSLWGWHDRAPFPPPLRVTCLPSRRLHLDVPGNLGHSQVAVIDCPGTAHGRPITLSAVLAASHVMIPIAPTPVEYRSLADVRAILADANDLRPNGPPRIGVLLVRVRGGAASGPAFRAALARDGWPVLRGEVRLLERFAQAVGEPVVDASRTAYADAAAELLDLDRLPRHAAAGGAA